MNGLNINWILSSYLGKRMKKNKNYEGSYIHAPDGFKSLWVFFSWKVRNQTLKRYLKEGRSMCGSRNAINFGGCESLDKNEIIEVYGKKVIIFS